MKIKKQTLQNALSLVKPGLAGKELIEQSTSFAFMGKTVVTYNDEISLSHPVEGLNIVGAVKADELYQLLSKLKQDEIDVEVTENEIIIVAGKSRAGLTLQQEIKLPLDEITEATDWKRLPSDFIENLTLARQSCGVDMSRAVLTCVDVSSKGVMTSSDGFSVFRINPEKPTKQRGYLLPGTIAREVIKLKPIEYCESEGWVHYKTAEGTVLSCRIFEDKFPSVDNLLPVEGETITFPEKIIEMLDRAGVFSQREHSLDESITIQLENKKLKVKSESDNGWYEEEVNLRYTGKPLSFNVTPQLLQRMLEKTQQCIVSTTINRIRFETDKWEYIAVLRNA